VVYGYFPCQSSGNELIIYDPQDFQRPTNGAPTLREITRFHFPRQHERDRLCLADYFASTTSGNIDVVAFQLVTMGTPPSEAVESLQQAGDYSEAYFVHGLSVQMAEALAEYSNRVVQRELGLERPRGRRYSWGYPAIPDLQDQTKLFDLLPIRSATGVEITESYQFVPEQTTAALVVHHQQATYFAVRTGAEVAQV
jgi:5-methyltetrahydrofolate--homocysteine methyltransferase